MAERLEGGLGFVAGQGQFRLQGAGEDLLGRQQAVELDLLKNARGLAVVIQLVGLVGGGEAQAGGFLRLAAAGLLQKFLDAGLRRARQFAQGGGGGAGTGGQQGGQGKQGERTQAGGHLNVPGTGY